MNLNQALNDAILKGARRATRKSVTGLRRDVAELKRQVAEMRRLLSGLRKSCEAPAAEAGALPEEAQKAGRKARPSGPMVRRLRARLGLTQAELAGLLEVSALTVSKWESAQGRILLRARTLAALERVRAMGRRDVRAALPQA